MTDKQEMRQCNDCGETWIDTGDQDCPFCGSLATDVITDDAETE